MPNKNLNRLTRLLDFIENNLSAALNLDVLAEVCQCSRWQMQRIFAHHTGMTTAQYVRERRLSLSAQALLNTKDRQLDIAMRYGFDSEASFSRCFSQHFGLSPSKYRKRGQHTSIRLPMQNFQPLRIEHCSGFRLHGNSCTTNGVLSEQPDFHEPIGQLWETCLSQSKTPEQLVSAIDTTGHETGRIQYWVGNPNAKFHKSNEEVIVPAQHYLVLSHRQHLASFSVEVEHLIETATRQLQLEIKPGFDKETYFNLPSCVKGTTAEYWLAIES